MLKFLLQLDACLMTTDNNLPGDQSRQQDLSSSATGLLRCYLVAVVVDLGLDHGDNENFALVRRDLHTKSNTKTFNVSSTNRASFGQTTRRHI